jgi:hypothetical protein
VQTFLGHNQCIWRTNLRGWICIHFNLFYTVLQTRDQDTASEWPKDMLGLMHLRESLNSQSTQVFLHSRRALEGLPNSVAIEIRKENFVRRECVHITTQANEMERYSLALTRALEIISNQDTQMIMDIRLVCSIKIFTHYLEEIHPSKGRRMVESKLHSAIQHINSANLRTRPFREALGLSFPRSVSG